MWTHYSTEGITVLSVPRKGLRFKQKNHLLYQDRGCNDNRNCVLYENINGFDGLPTFEI